MEVTNFSDYSCLLKHCIVILSLILTILTITVIERSSGSRIPSDFITHSRWIRATPKPLEPVQPATTLKPQQQTPKWECELPKQLQGVKITRLRDNRIEITCEEFYYLEVDGRSYHNSYEAFCLNGEWLDSKNYKCLPLCKPFKSPSARYNCTYNKEKVDCSKPMWPGTILEAECAVGYEEIQSLYSVNKNKCLENGKWEVSQPFTCKEECGKIYNAKDVLAPQISGGVSANIPEYPWNVGIYQLGKDGKHEHLCGGSLITAFVVLTAAHCLKDYENEKRENLKIAVGKYYREWDIENNIITQKRNISHIYVFEEYRGVYTHYEYDIGLAELEFPVTFNIAVRSVCLPISPQIANPEGMIVGWGLNQNNVAADELQLAKLEYLSREKCLNKVQGTESLTKDKFCAKITSEQNATNIMAGAAGSGFVFKSSKKFYIHGIVSTKIDGRIPTFTNITYVTIATFLNNKLDDIRSRFGQKYDFF